ncbi:MULTISPECIES: glycoside hydrolase family 2 protein [Culturomica]|uniref:glycoside hydrolase family 2 protein n=1 Tax=Culturomica TaxID=1926651 RepID=UPI000E9051B4|nr:MULTISPECIES: glycoside hydrolase family 2 TIM barrel-domain containing protein [Culturomica]HBO27559.1 glycoside hydrolase family 2 [Culturomica sp.]
MKLFALIAFCVCLGACSPGERMETPNAVPFNDNWLFTRSAVTPESLPPDSMKSVTLPHTPRIEPMTVNDQWQGICYYAKKFETPEKVKEKLLSLRFEAAMNIADIWLNGKHLGTHTGGYLPFTVSLDNALNKSGENLLVVRLDNRDNAVTGPKPLHLLDFCTYGGIYRNVWLIVKDSLHITDPIARQEGGIFVHASNISSRKAGINIRVNVDNCATEKANAVIDYEIRNATGKTILREQNRTIIAPGTDTTLTTHCSIENPELWSPESPNLYTLITSVSNNGRTTDREEVRFGIRDLKITPEGLWLNGKKRFLRGVNRHQEYPYIGYALSDEAQRRDAQKIKDAGFDYVRSSHYPQSPAFLDACDELGIMVLDAILGWQYFGDSLFTAHALQSSRELIRRDRNHPCILGWELSINETQMPQNFTEAANRIAREEFPYDDCYTAGWMKEAYDIYIEARQHRHSAHLSQPLIVSEYGDWEYYAQNAGFHQNTWNDLLEEERNSRQPRQSGEKRLLQQALNIQEAHNDNLTTHAFADGYWAMFDYNRGYADDLEYSGIMDITRLPKFSYYFFRSQRDTPETVFIASYWQPGVSRQVKVFSNCEEVELYADGKLTERRRPDNDNFSTRLSHPPFTFNIACQKPGTVKAIGYKNGQAVAEYSVTTPAKAAKLTLKVDESGIAPARNDVLFIYATVCDADGNPVHHSADKITFHIKGAQLCSPTNIRAEAGIATALIRTADAPASISISAEAPGLEPAQTTISIQ